MGKKRKLNKMPFFRRKAAANRNHKDVLFRFIFQSKEDLLDLYNAVNQSSYTNPDDLEINTLDNVIYLKMKNDLSFVVGSTLNLYEHQSTYNPNMPLRGLLYFSELYEGMVAEREWNIYGKSLVRLPTPQYIVFYNGSASHPDQVEMKLSDAFENPEVPGCLERRAIMLNINLGHNREIMEKCIRLKEYSIFIAEVNMFIQEGYKMKQAIDAAVDSCIDKGVLKDILIRNRSEVIHMLLTEYDEKKHLAVTFAEGYEEGEQVGYSKGELFTQIRIIRKSIQKYSISEISNMLELDMEYVGQIVSVLEQFPEKSIPDIAAIVKKEK